jgi:hypothetical protein
MVSLSPSDRFTCSSTGAHHFTGAAPGRSKIDQYRFIRTYQFLEGIHKKCLPPIPLKGELKKHTKKEMRFFINHFSF